MADTNDTIDGLLAEFRGYAAGMPPSYHVTMSWHDFRVMLDRFQAAHNRERGDAAKLREALVSVQKKIHYLIGSLNVPNSLVANRMEINGIINAALSAPPRNCDVMDWRTAWKMWREKFHPETPVGYSAVVKGTEAFMDWFTAPATKKEGGAK